jgi:uncharacterized protein (DUF2141 family)
MGRMAGCALVGFALVAGLAVPATGAQRDPAGHFADAGSGKPQCTLRILVTGFRNDKGKAGGVVFASPAGWPEDRSKAVTAGGFDIRNRQATEEFKVPPGKYGVAVFHDENANMKLDRNFLGIPKEGFGFANNPRVLLSAPSFQAASAQVSCPVTEIRIRLIYK